MNVIILVFIIGAALAAAVSGRMDAVGAAIFDSAEGAVNIAFGLIGPMVVFLGLVNVLRDAGAVGAVARGLYPVMRRLFPEIPRGHPATGAMVMNFAANMFGLGNAATPLGLKAMQELEKLNPSPGTATNSMALFLAINTSGISVLPLGVVAIRASMDSQEPGAIILPSLLATATSTAMAVLMAKTLSGLPAFRVAPAGAAPTREESEDRASGGESTEAAAQGESLESIAPPGASPRALLATRVCAALLGLAVLAESLRIGFGMDLLAGVRETVFGQEPLEAAPLVQLPEALSALPAALGALLLAPVRGLYGLFSVLTSWLIPLFLATVGLVGLGRGVKVYESAVKGAREGFDIFVMIVPFLTLILVAVGMFRASGGLDLLLAAVSPIVSAIGFPPEALLMALVRPLSGSGAMGVMTETMTTYGPDSFVGTLVGVLNGTTETTFYVLAVYFGSVRIRAVRHTLAACLTADVVGMLSALFYTSLFFG